VFFTGKLNNKFVKIWLLKILPPLKCIAIPCDLSIITLKISLVSDIDVLQGRVARCVRCGGIFNNHFIANFLANPSVKIS